MTIYGMYVTDSLYHEETRQFVRVGPTRYFQATKVEALLIQAHVSGMSRPWPVVCWSSEL